MRLFSLPLLRHKLLRKIWIIINIIIWAIFLIGRFWQEGFRSLGMQWLGIIFLLAVTLFIADLISGFGLLLPRFKNYFRLLGIGAGIILVIMAHIQGFSDPMIKHYEVTITKLAPHLNGTRIVLLTDLHLGAMGLDADWLKKRVEQVQALKPDLILLGGDLFERQSSPAEFIPIMRQLSAPFGVFAVRGNHDSIRASRRDVTGEILRYSGIELLNNRWAQTTEGLLVAGIDDLTSSRKALGKGEDDLRIALNNRPPTVTTILLSHTPWLVEKAASNNVQLMLSGHTHHGQIWPFNYLVALRYPLIYGRYLINEMPLIVSGGTGTWGPRMRLGGPGEIVLITLYAK